MKRALNILHSLFAWLVCGMMVIVVARTILPIVIFVFRLREEEVYFAAAKVWSRILFLLSGIKIKARGLEKIPIGQPVLIAANHQSYVDILLLFEMIPFRFRFVAMEVLFKTPFFGYCMKRTGCIPVQDDAIRSFKAIRLMINMVKAGESLLIFPEGGIPEGEGLGSFNPGIAMLALHTGARVIPVAIKGTREILPRKSCIFNPGTIELKVGDPMVFPRQGGANTLLLNEVTGKIRGAVASLLLED